MKKSSAIALAGALALTLGTQAVAAPAAKQDAPAVNKTVKGIRRPRFQAASDNGLGQPENPRKGKTRPAAVWRKTVPPRRFPRNGSLKNHTDCSQRQPENHNKEPP